MSVEVNSVRGWSPDQPPSSPPYFPIRLRFCRQRSTHSSGG